MSMLPPTLEEERRDEAAVRRQEEREARIEVYSADLFTQYLTDPEMIVDVLLEDTEVLHEIAEAFVNPTIDEGNVYKIIRKHIQNRANEDAKEQMEDRNTPWST